MAEGTYDTIAGVYEFPVPDALLAPQGSADAFAEHVVDGARVLDCGCGTGTLAVGLALRGCDVVPTDAGLAPSPSVISAALANGIDKETEGPGRANGAWRERVRRQQKLATAPIPPHLHRCRAAPSEGTRFLDAGRSPTLEPSRRRGPAKPNRPCAPLRAAARSRATARAGAG